jgi:hypothetical protein
MTQPDPDALADERERENDAVDALAAMSDEDYAAAVAEPSRTCSHPGDQEHDHAVCEDVVAGRQEPSALMAVKTALDWLIEHPDTPSLVSLRLDCTVNREDEPDATKRLSGLLDFAEKNGATLHEGVEWAWAVASIAGARPDPTRIEFIYWIQKAHGAGKVLP